MLISCILFVIYPAIIYFLVASTIKALIVSYCIAILLFILIKNKYKKETILLDTSVLSDERLLDVIESNIYNKFVLPRFVLREIENRLEETKDQIVEHNIDKIKENKKVKILYKNYKNIKSADFKILKLAKSLNGKIVTANFGLNKMASIQNIKILDLNDLFERLKPIVLPGRKIPVVLVKEGKEKNQAVGFLDDGTIVVAENGRNFVGKKVNIKITSLMHTASNKMVFGKIPNEEILEGKL